MFGPNPDSPGHSKSGLAGTVVIPTRSVWPYGGRRLFLSGSFTGWSEHILMSPMEGCPNVFQAMCNLNPGYHQVDPNSCEFSLGKHSVTNRPKVTQHSPQMWEVQQSNHQAQKWKALLIYFVAMELTNLISFFQTDDVGQRFPYNTYSQTQMVGALHTLPLIERDVLVAGLESPS